MTAHRIHTTLTQDSELKLTGLPFQAGDVVEVIILGQSSQKMPSDRYPLRGKPLEYDRPTDPVALEDWDALR